MVVADAPLVEPTIVLWSVALLPKPQVPVPQTTDTAVAPVLLPMVIAWATALSPIPIVLWLRRATVPLPPWSKRLEESLEEPILITFLPVPVALLPMFI